LSLCIQKIKSQKNKFFSLGKLRGGCTSSKMTTNIFETIVYESEPSTPERRTYTPPTPRAPSRLRRGRSGMRGRGQYNREDSVERTYRDESIENLLKKYFDTKIEIENLKSELLNIRNENIINAETISTNKLRLEHIQELLFENSINVPNWLYIQLMNALVMYPDNN